MWFIFRLRCVESITSTSITSASFSFTSFDLTLDIFILFKDFTRDFRPKFYLDQNLGWSEKRGIDDIDSKFEHCPPILRLLEVP